MDWTALVSILAAVVSILVPLITCFGFLYKEIKEWRKETREEITKFEEEIRIQSQRSDKLYEMFIDLLKSQNPKTNP